MGQRLSHYSRIQREANSGEGDDGLRRIKTGEDERRISWKE
jgi:hypothetical protein